VTALSKYERWTDNEIALLEYLWTSEKDVNYIQSMFPTRRFCHINAKAKSLNFQRLKGFTIKDWLIDYHWSDIDIGWFAGFFDGEGSVGIFPPNKARKQNCFANMHICNTKIESLEKIQHLVKFGDIYSKIKRNPNHSTIYYYRLGKREVLYSVLNKLLPHLIIKKKIALLVHDFLFNNWDRQLSKEDQFKYVHHSHFLIRS